MIPNSPTPRVSPTQQLPPQNGEVKRLAAIDVGTNSIRLIVVEAVADGSYRLLDDEKAVTRLGRGLAASGELRPESMDASLLAIARMREIAESYNVEAIRTVGTAAVREAANQADFIHLLEQRTGLRLEVVSAEEEARLAFSSVESAFDISSIPAAVVDVGGGSTEIVLSTSGAIEEIYPVPLGAVRLTEEFGTGDRVDREAFRAMKRSIRRMIRKHAGRLPFVPQIMFGVGGTFTALAAVSMHRGAVRGESDLLPFTVRGFEMQRSEVRHVLDWLCSMPLKARARVAGLSPDRAEIIVAGLAIVECVMKRLEINTLRVHDRGIRDGIILGMIRDHFPGAARPALDPRDRLRSVRQFAAACHYEERHCHHVATLSLELFDQLAADVPDRAWTQPVNRELLEAAALLHDIGYLINYTRHHKHAYHLIVHSDLAGFTRRELEIIANVARYHRRAAPNVRHRGFAKLSEDDQRLVCRLAAILRVADGLDRTHMQAVTAAEVHLGASKARFSVVASDEPTVDMWGAEQKCGLFERVFGVRARFRWVGDKPRGHGEDDGAAIGAPSVERRSHAANGHG